MKAVQILISYVNLIFILIMLKLCFKIGSTNEYLVYSTLLFASGFIVYILLKKFFLKKGLLLTVILLICFIVMLFIGADFFIYGDTLSKLFNEIPEQFIYLYYNLETISIHLVVPYMIIIVPIVGFLYTHCALKGRNFIDVIVNIILMIVLWFWHYENILIKYAYIYCCIGIFSFMFDGYYRAFKNYKGRRKERINSFVSFIIISLLAAGFSYELISRISSQHSGVYSDLIYTKLNDFDDGQFTSSSNINHKFSGIDSITEASKEKIGGSLDVDNTPQFEVKAKRPIYLKASSKNKYDDDNNTWDNDYNKLVKIPKKQFIYDDRYVKEDKYYLEKKLYSSLKSLNISKSDIEINYDKSMLFHPYLIYDVNNVDTFLSPQNSIFKDDNTGGYNISYYDYGEDVTLDKAYSDGDGAGKLFKDDKGKTTFTNSEYKDYKKYNEQFIGGYNNIDGRIIKLVNKIVKGSKSDAEKAYRIEQYLKNNYTYSLEVKNIDRNLLYNFLFNEKKGYCVYFATAMTVMCKIANVPARYAEGVKMINRKNSDGNYVVTNADAHAWTEVLINPELNMWYIADATPSAAQYLYENDSEYNKNAHASTSQKINQNLNEGSKQGIKNTNKSSYSSTKKKSTTVKKSASGEKKINYNLESVISLLILILLLRVAYKKFSQEQAIKYKNILKLYSLCLKRLKSIGIYKPLNIGEIEFAENIEDAEVRAIIKCLAAKVYSEYYGGDNEEKFDKRSFYDRFEAAIRKKQGVIRYYFFRYLW
ncbi:transglutaminase domain-containing protein [Clostridium neuense]|uniref:Transglutaminase domain-containing protein n=1 Tax=Clostridium neuense TaxID=1728934 RepID=A0ABW8TDA0_9CLOT